MLTFKDYDHRLACSENFFSMIMNLYVYIPPIFTDKMIRLRSPPVTTTLFMTVVVLSSRSISMVRAGEQEDKRAECQMWAHLENKTLPLQVAYLPRISLGFIVANFCQNTWLRAPIKFGIIKRGHRGRRPYVATFEVEDTIPLLLQFAFRGFFLGFSVANLAKSSRK
jgi:hypothetical protein